MPWTPLGSRHRAASVSLSVQQPRLRVTRRRIALSTHRRRSFDSANQADGGHVRWQPREPRKRLASTASVRLPPLPPPSTPPSTTLLDASGGLLVPLRCRDGLQPASSARCTAAALLRDQHCSWTPRPRQPRGQARTLRRRRLQDDNSTEGSMSSTAESHTVASAEPYRTTPRNAAWKASLSATREHC